MSLGARTAVKRALGGLPLTAEVYQRLAGPEALPASGYALRALDEALPGWARAARAARLSAPPDGRRRLLVIGYLSWWLEYACALGLLLAGDGHQVDLAFLPYRRWVAPVDRFDVGRQRAYLRRVLGRARPILGLHDLSAYPAGRLPDDLLNSIESLSRIDVQYTQQREDLDLSPVGRDLPLYRLRLERNRRAAASAWRLLRRGAYDTVIIPNGSILEFGAIFRAAQRLGVRAVTYEFGEQRQRMWLAQGAEVMRHDTSALWQARGSQPLSPSQRAALEDLYLARRGGRPWANFARQWQPGESRGAQAVRQQLGLDPSHPVALLCTNVVGDSLALGRQVFSRGMADWLARTVREFARRPGAQLVVRIHPGELLGAGHPSAEIVRAELPDLPEHVTVVPPESKVNTYDLMELAHLGLVYTTTVGMEMAMAGIPVIVAGMTHYRGKGFTDDPDSWETYQRALECRMAEPLGRRLPPEAVELAWRYAYRFFFEFPFAFPWHLVGFWGDVGERPFERVVAPDGRAPYAAALRALAGEPVDLTPDRDLVDSQVAPWSRG